MNIRLSSLLAALLILWPDIGAAQGIGDLLPFDELVGKMKGDEEGIAVIQNRKFELDHELSFWVGTLPADPYYKGLTGSASYTWHLHEAFAWEVAQFTYSLNFGTFLRGEVERVARSTTGSMPGFPTIEWVLASRLVFKPFYGKQAFLNTNVVHLEAFLCVGPDWMYVQGVEGNAGRVRDRLDVFGFDFGGGVRLFLTDVVSLRLDLNEIIFFVPKGVLQALHARLGVSFNFRVDE